MLEVKARLLHRAVFIPEEPINCELIITNVDKSCQVSENNSYFSTSLLNSLETFGKSKQNDFKSNDHCATIAWGSAQIYCQCDINDKKVKIPVLFQKNFKNSQTSFKPILVMYSQSLPLSLPPSYSGQYLKISYKVSIGIGGINQPLCIINLPFKLFEMKCIYKALKTRFQNHLSDGIAKNQVNEKTKNPFQEDDTDRESSLEISMDLLTNITTTKNLNTYNIQSANGIVGKFCLSKVYYRLGEDVLGMFEFSKSSIPCIKYTVCLQFEESISKECLANESVSNLIHYTTVSQHTECVKMAAKTSFALPIPITCTSQFTHKIVSVNWRLHFEFIIEKTSNEDSSNENTFHKNSSIIYVETMLWNLPVHVVSTNPIQASLMMQSESSETIYIE
ncbi:RAB6A-GEF complex partner protein 2 isoform X1 [Hydra vulgaris]|uniref:RAB6A-GEF complex partner protein 2 isoform X1 n=1 Tax=Hydra vulgaris TaxID=6087 RepID=A0ABM4D9K2_HYDVU